MTRAALAAAAAALVVVAAGCGGARETDPASLLPATTVRFVAARTDADWQPLARRVLGRVPPLPKGVEEFAAGVLADGSTVVAVKSSGRWSRAPLARSLAADARYREAAAQFPDGTVAEGYVRGQRVVPLLEELPGQLVTSLIAPGLRFRVVAHPIQRPTFALLQFKWGAAWVTRDGAGFRARSAGLPLARSYRVRTVQLLAPAYEPALFDEIPADVLAVADFPLALGTFELMQQLPPPLTRLFARSGPALPSQLDAILGGETALYARAGGEVTLVTSPPDVTTAIRTLQELAPAFDRPLYHLSIGGQLVVSTSRPGLAAFRGGGPKLSADEVFRGSGLPDRFSAAIYVRQQVFGVRPLTAWAVPDGADPTWNVRFAS